MDRGYGRQAIFQGEKYYEYFLQHLEQTHKRLALEIHAYYLMRNHYPLLVRAPRDFNLDTHNNYLTSR